MDQKSGGAFVVFTPKHKPTNHPVVWTPIAGRVRRLAFRHEEPLDEEGKTGWELVSMTGFDGVGRLAGKKLCVVLKRRI
jgi:hypothetical protein